MATAQQVPRILSPRASAVNPQPHPQEDRLHSLRFHLLPERQIDHIDQGREGREESFLDSFSRLIFQQSGVSLKGFWGPGQITVIPLLLHS